MMTEERIGFMCSLASSLSQENESYKFLRSYYLMRCNEIAKGYGLPMKHFSRVVRCPRCCLEWTRDTKVNVQPIKIDKKPCSIKNTQRNKKKSRKRKSLLHCNEMEQICSFCTSSTKTKLVKPEKQYIKSASLIESSGVKNKLKENNPKDKKIRNEQKKAKVKKKKLKNTKAEPKLSSMVNLYSNTYDVFSLKNDKNTLTSALKEPSKVIKNNKKKKDKFAGLCQKAVLASAKLKQQKEAQPQTTQNKLNLFLKPSV